MALCAVRRVDQASSKAHWRQTIQVQPLREKLLQVRPSGIAHEETSVVLNVHGDWTTVSGCEDFSFHACALMHVASPSDRQTGRRRPARRPTWAQS